ncbi:hypothetical protein KGM_215027B, partial [Danaus plexippus plexippus]
VFCSYSRARRSRRLTLSRLAERYSHRLHMEPRVEGGYVLKCGGVLELVWELQNKWSILADFQHKMKFDLEYMGESYIKIISSAHRQLSEPAVDTDERTSLLAKILDTCLQAEAERAKEQGSVSEQGEVMAPPKTIPKKNMKDTRKRDRDRDSGSDVTDGVHLQDADKEDKKRYKDKRKATDTQSTERDKRKDTGNEKIKKDNGKENNNTQKNIDVKKAETKIHVTKTEHLSERFNKNRRINRSKEMRKELTKKKDIKSKIPQKSIQKTQKKNTLTVNARALRTPLAVPRSSPNTLRTHIPRLLKQTHKTEHSV